LLVCRPVLASFSNLWPNLQMWKAFEVCDACRIARATVETESGFFLCEECEAVVVIAFEEFELPPPSPFDEART
jgi:hypothetical protein